MTDKPDELPETWKKVLETVIDELYIEKLVGLMCEEIAGNKKASPDGGLVPELATHKNSLI